MTGLLGNSEFCFPRITMFPSTSSRETLRFSGNKIHCSSRDQSLSVNCDTRNKAVKFSRLSRSRPQVSMGEQKYSQLLRAKDTVWASVILLRVYGYQNIPISYLNDVNEHELLILLLTSWLVLYSGPSNLVNRCKGPTLNFSMS